MRSRNGSISGPVGAAGVAAVLAVGCAGDADSGSRPPAPAPMPGREAEDPAFSAEAYPEAAYEAEAVDVALLEYVIGMPTRLPSGPTVLRLSNQGFEMHNLKLVDPASGEVLWETETDVNTGEVRLVELDLSPGSYTVVCDVAGHDSRGMLMTLTVEASPSP